ncbi:Ig-like domain-containing protein [Actinoallomurus spadix]|uniref:BIG2 domain-containing protein n=1 Tax=Actinoallomurus spadix TaxID=79912 RepID=A0ABN0WLS5_9ACTN|nr:Ig-like domain-containing protein [Actinoallomurus spadix]MCO5984553.1 Ig-like domain-containing protein [Actinoallomurus spadix]
MTADDVVEAVNNDQSFVDLAHAKVHYGSSDPHLATVDDTGHVKVVGSGVATINVKVGGVTGRKGGDETAASVGVPFSSVPGAYDNVAMHVFAVASGG